MKRAKSAIKMVPRWAPLVRSHNNAIVPQYNFCFINKFRLFRCFEDMSVLVFRVVRGVNCFTRRLIIRSLKCYCFVLWNMFNGSLKYITQYLGLVIWTVYTNMQEQLTESITLRK